MRYVKNSYSRLKKGIVRVIMADPLIGMTHSYETPIDSKIGHAIMALVNKNLTKKQLGIRT